MSPGSRQVEGRLDNGETYTMDIRYYGTGLIVEVLSQGSTMASLRCRPWLNQLSVPVSQSGHIQGLAGTGEAGKEWKLGPSPSFVQFGKSASVLMDRCSPRYTYMNRCSDFNGNSVEKPTTKWSDSYMVDATSSLFTYGSGQYAYGWWTSARTVNAPGQQCSQCVNRNC